MGSTMKSSKPIHCNFRDFNIEHDPYNNESIELLERQGIDLKKNREKGIDSSDFAWMVLSPRHFSSNSSCPGLLFMLFFGVRVYDTKLMMGSISGLRGGLERVAKLLGVERTTGSRHQAGSDSLLNLQTFVRFKDSYANLDLENMNGYEGMLFGLCEGWRGFDRTPEVFVDTSTQSKPQCKQVYSV
ncbi:hypothetical protein DKX38_004982 [Salix brachista]|uniref:Uncharacterized protein n=1 Tax=Salix brachista TaxID=2182728 RepID=A0A5N5NCZ7_9ROSI|nr:hypothetical protein DKX38_004982 [Salix brachista]